MATLRFLAAWTVAVVCAFYLLNPAGGRHELIPDAWRYWGNLDELLASVLLLSALRFFGVDVCRFFSGKERDASGTE